MKNRLTFFGEFAVGIRGHFVSGGAWYPSLHELVWEMTQQESESQASRYMHEHNADKELFFYHKSTIAQIIASSYAGSVPDKSLLRGRGKGYEFVGKRDDAVSVKALAAAIEGVMGPMLKNALHRCPLRPNSPFCKEMYKLYDERYGRTDPHSSDLERYILSIDEEFDTARKSEEIYKRLLLAILLGKEAVPAIASFSSTAVMADSRLDMVVDGFTLTQLVKNKNGEIVPMDSCGFEPDAEVAIGLSTNPQVTYSPVFEDGIRPYISSDHAVICPDSDDGTCFAWKLINHSESNGTAVSRADGSVWKTKTRGDSTRIYPGDEIWLAPRPTSDGVCPQYRLGAVLRFDQILTRPHQSSPKTKVTRPKPDVEPGNPAPTPVFKDGGAITVREKTRVGFVLEDKVYGSKNMTYRYADIADDDGYFYLLLGRQGNYTVGNFLGSAIARKHAYIESLIGTDQVHITNRDSNEVVVRHVGGSFVELGEWSDSEILSDGDEIYLAGGVSDSTVYAASNGTVLRFRYLYKVDAEE